jgi:hypothetical protein
VKAGTSTTATPGIGDCTKYAVEGTFGGVSQPTGNRWRPGKTYMVNDKIYPNVQCGKTFKCTVGGTTVGDTRGGGESQSENTVGAGQTPNIGEPDWFTDTSDPYGSVRSVIQETNGGPRWVPDVDDPEPQWDFTAASPCLAKAFQALHDYTHGASVFGASFDRLFTATWADPTTTQASGASMPAGFATAKYPSELGYTPGDDVVVDGGITWYCTSPDGLVPDNGVVWAARVAGAYQVYAPQVLIKEPYVQDAPTTAIGFFSTATAAQFLLSDFSAIKGPGSLFGNGVGIYARGGDASGIRVDDLLLVAQEQDYWGDPADHCIDDNSFLGNHYSNISVQGCSGWALAMRGGAQSGTAKSLYFEGFGRRSPVAGVNQIGPGGTASRGAFRISSVEVNGALSTGGPIILNDGAYNIVTTSHSDQDETMYTRAYLSGGRGLCFNMDSYNYNSPGTFDDPLGIAYVYNIYLGWWTRLQGGSWPIYSLGGLHATNVGHAHMWIHRGFQLGISTTFFVFADVAEYANTFTRAGLRYKGDLYHLPALVSRGRYFQRVVLDDGGAGGITWSAGATYSVDTYVVPTEGAGTANHRAYLVTTGGIAGGSEPSWDDTLGATVIDGAVHYTVVEGADVGFMNMVEDGAVGRTIQTSSTWADSADTDARTAAAKTAVRGRRHQKQTTTGSASQVVDDGILNSAIVGTDLTLPADSVVDITATLIVKKNGSADAGSIKMSGTFYRNGSGAPVRVGTDDNNAKLSSGVSGVTAALVINGNAVEVQVSPGSGITLDWGLARIHTERTS